MTDGEARGTERESDTSVGSDGALSWSYHLGNLLGIAGFILFLLGRVGIVPNQTDAFIVIILMGAFILIQDLHPDSGGEGT